MNLQIHEAKNNRRNEKYLLVAFNNRGASFRSLHSWDLFKYEIPSLKVYNKCHEKGSLAILSVPWDRSRRRKTDLIFFPEVTFLWSFIMSKLHFHRLEYFPWDHLTKIGIPCCWYFYEFILETDLFREPSNLAFGEQSYVAFVINTHYKYTEKLVKIRRLTLVKLKLWRLKNSKLEVWQTNRSSITFPKDLGQM